MIIDASYFQNKSVYIPNSIEQPTLGDNTPTAIEELNQEINEKEASLLLGALGYAQYNELISQFEEDGSWKEGADQKWKDLVDGKEEWLGLRYKIGPKKISLIAYYVYFYYLAADYSTYTTTGIVQSDAANSTPLAPVQKQVAAWNQFVKMYNPIYNSLGFMNPYFGTNWNGTWMSWSNGSIQGYTLTLYEFLANNSDIYDSSYFKHYRLINDLGL